MVPQQLKPTIFVENFEMANFTKWLVALGWSFGGPIGAIIGYVIGNAIDGFSQKDVKQFREQGNAQNTQSGDFESVY